MKEISKNLMCIKIGEMEVWTEADKMESLMSILKDKNAQQFIQIGDEIINRSFIVGVFKAKTMEDVTRRKNGQWKCKYGFWHERGEQCSHGELAKYKNYTTGK